MFVPRSSASSSGFTLVELAVVIVVVGIVASLGTGIIVEGGRVYARDRAQSANYAEARFALDRLALDVAVLTDRSQITEMGSHAITFTVSDSPVRYSLSGSQVLLGSQVLAGNVTRFDLVYYKADGTIATTAADIQRIAAELEVTQSGQAACLRTEVFPRTFRDVPVPEGQGSEDFGKDRRGGRRWWWWGRLFRWSRHRIW